MASTAAGTATSTQQKQESSSHPLYYVIRKSPKLSSPAIFLSWKDFIAFTTEGGREEQTESVEFGRFETMKEAVEFINNDRKVHEESKSATIGVISADGIIEVDQKLSKSNAAASTNKSKQPKKSLKVFENGEDFEKRLIEWQQYKDKNGGYDPTDVPKHEEGDGLGTWVDALKVRYYDFINKCTTCQRTNSKIPCLTAEQFDLVNKSGLWDRLRSDKLSFRAKPLWIQRVDELVAYKVKYGTTKTSKDIAEDLHKWCQIQRKEYKLLIAQEKQEEGGSNDGEHDVDDDGAKKKKKSNMTNERRQILEDIGFLFQLNCTDKTKRKQPATAKNEDGDGDGEQPKKKQRQSRKGQKYPATANQKGPHRTWETSYELLVEYKLKHGHCNLPKRYKPDTALGYWVHGQRKAFKKFIQGQKSSMTEEKISKLRQLEFNFTPKMGNHKSNNLAEARKLLKESFSDGNGSATTATRTSSIIEAAATIGANNDDSDDETDDEDHDDNIGEESGNDHNGSDGNHHESNETKHLLDGHHESEGIVPPQSEPQQGQYDVDVGQHHSSHYHGAIHQPQHHQQQLGETNPGTATALGRTFIPTWERHGTTGSGPPTARL